MYAGSPGYRGEGVEFRLVERLVGGPEGIHIKRRAQEAGQGVLHGLQARLVDDIAVTPARSQAVLSRSMITAARSSTGSPCAWQ